LTSSPGCSNINNSIKVNKLNKLNKHNKFGEEEKIMPYKINPSNANYKPSEKLPNTLAHKPVYALPYEKFDGIYAGDTDTKYITVGISQWSPYEVSVKTMRHVGKRWTRLAEEMPLHRAIDVTLFLTKVVFDQQNGRVDIPADTFFRQAADISITSEARTNGEMASYYSFLSKHSKLLKERLRTLAEVLNSLKENGKI
jgi:hypothetical protein